MTASWLDRRVNKYESRYRQAAKQSSATVKPVRRCWNHSLSVGNPASQLGAVRLTAK